MKRIPDYPPPIRPLPANTQRPLWSVMIPVYNCSEYLKYAIRSVLQQDPGPEQMQIEVVDDCSTDADVEKLVEAIGKGRVTYFRQPQNVGSVRNFETCLNRSRGRLIHLLHSDDAVKEGFYKTLGSLFEKFPEAGAAFCNFSSIDEKGAFLYDNESQANEPTILKDFLYTITVRCPIQYVTIAVRREVYEKCGAFYGTIYGEDWEMWGRIAKDFPIAYSPEVLAEYRIHQHNISSNSFRTGDNIRDISRVINILSGYLPEKDQLPMNRKARKHYAKYALAFTEHIWHVSRDKKAVYRQVAGSLKMFTDLPMILKAIKLYTKVWLHPFRKLIGNVDR